MTVLPMWLFPIEQMSEQAIAIMCDADRRPTNAMETLLIRVQDDQPR